MIGRLALVLLVSTAGLAMAQSTTRPPPRPDASDPTMWRDVFLTNREAVLEMLGRFTEDLIELQRAIRFGDGDTLHRLFTDARAIRRGVVQAGQDRGGAEFYRMRDGVRDKGDEPAS